MWAVMITKNRQYPLGVSNPVSVFAVSGDIQAMQDDECTLVG